jgi:hypothetical protein
VIRFSFCLWQKYLPCDAEFSIAVSEEIVCLLVHYFFLNWALAVNEIHYFCSGAGDQTYDLHVLGKFSTTVLTSLLMSITCHVKFNQVVMVVTHFSIHCATQSFTLMIKNFWRVHFLWSGTTETCPPFVLSYVTCIFEKSSINIIQWFFLT